MPDEPEVTVIQDGAPETLQVQAAPALSVTVPLPEAFEYDALVGDNAAPMHGLAAWVTVRLLPATENAALRSAPAFDAAVTFRVALPVPEVDMAIQAGLPLTVHVHADGAVTETVEVAPP